MVSFLLRGINMNRWLECLGTKAGPETNDCRPALMADVMIDVKTEGNRLSVYEIDEERDRLRLVVGALAANRGRLQAFDYVLLRKSVLDALQITTEQTLGETKHSQVNSFHVHLEGLTLYQLIDLVLFICCNNVVLDEQTDLDLMTCTIQRMDKPEVAEAIIDAINENHIVLSDLKPELQKQIRERMQQIH